MGKKTNNQDTMNLLCNIAWLRKHHGLSKKKMAALLGVGVSTVSKIEHGQLPPRLCADILYAVYEHFGISPSALFQQWLGE